MFRRLLVVVFCSAFITSCFSPPEYPKTPEIAFKSITYSKGGQPLPDDPSQVAADSIILVLSFKDGDGDVGIGSSENYPPFNDRWYYVKPISGPPVSSPDECLDGRCWDIDKDNTQIDKYIAKYVDYSDRKKAGYDTLKGFVKPFNCINWDVVYWDHDKNKDTPTVVLDTLFFTLNPHYNNIFVEFETKVDDPSNPTNTYETFNEQVFFTYPSCGVRTFHGRIPILSEDLNSDTPLEGQIRYAIPSTSFETIFGAKTLRLRVYIEDRALHKSNTVFTRDFTLTE